MLEQVNIGIVGSGNSVNMYGPALRFIENARVVAWMDPNQDAVSSAVSQYGGIAYTKYDDLLAHPDLHAVIIVSPPWLHAEQTVKALDNGIHVLCEKPMARTVAECEAMLIAERRSSAFLMIGFMKRFQPVFQLVKRMIDNDELGTLIEIKSDWSWTQYRVEAWRDKEVNQGGLFLDHGSHTLDLARWWAGNMQSLTANVRIYLEGRQVEDYAQVVCQHESGCISTHYNSRLTHRPLRETYLLEGSKASLEISCERKWSFLSVEPFEIKKYRNGQVEYLAPQFIANLDERLSSTWMYRGSLQYFVDCIIKDDAPQMCTGEDGKWITGAINASYVASIENRSVKLPFDEVYDPKKIFKKLQEGKRIEGE